MMLNYSDIKIEYDHMKEKNRLLEADNAELKERVERLEKALEYCSHVCEQGRVWGGMGWTWNNRIAKLVYNEAQQAMKGGE